MARVNVEQIAFGDPRYAVLGNLIGRDKWSALGRMTAVWNVCQERGSYVVSIENLNFLFDDCSNFAEAIVKAGLGKPHRHGVYICGTKGRIEWLINKRDTARENGKQGGRPKKTYVGSTSNQDRLPGESAPAPAPAPALKEESKALRPTRTARTFTEDSREMKAARYLFSKIKANNGEAKEPNWQGWAKSFDLIFRVDKRNADDVRRLIDWCQADPFWHKVVLSPDALRRDYDRLTVNAKEQPTAKLAAFDRTRPVV